MKSRYDVSVPFHGQAVWIRPPYSLIKLTTLSLLQTAISSASYNRPALRNYGLVLRATSTLIPVQPSPTLSCVHIDAANQFFAPRSFTDIGWSPALPTLLPSVTLIQLFMTTKLSRTCAIYEAPLLVHTLYL